MAILDVPGGRLSYVAEGDGPALVMIPGAAGTGDVFGALAERLADRHTVVRYDRRGFSRSELDDPTDDDQRLETDADDAARLIEHLGIGHAIVFGSSSGAIVGLELVVRHPAVVRMLLAHEPPLMRHLAQGQEWIDFYHRVYQTYRRSGIESAMRSFRERTLAPSERQTLERGPANEHGRANSAYWFEHELRQYPAAELDMDALRAHADHVVLTVGRESAGYPPHEATVRLGAALGRAPVEVPGGHIGYALAPADFAEALRGVIASLG